jgi:hypothetical protein
MRRNVSGTRQVEGAGDLPKEGAVRMRARWTVLAWSLFGLFAGLTAGNVALVLWDEGSSEGLLILLGLVFGLVGALVASREPGNAVGWLLLTVALSFALTSFADSYILAAGRPFDVAIAWVDTWVWYPWLYLAAIALPLVFPDGRLISPRWRVVMWTGIVSLLLGMASAAFKAGPLQEKMPGNPPNPLGVGGTTSRLLSVAGGLSNVLLLVGFLLAGASLIVRLRRSHGRARQQLKWFAYAGALAVVGLALAMFDVFNESLGGSPTPAWSQVIGGVGWAITLGSLLVGIPAAIGIAMLRHRLYGIDVVINRTLVYGSLTVLLAATYIVLVIGLRSVLEPVTGQSDLAVAASTLAVAGLFRPMRARIQHVVDRRFFRSRYDATRTLEGFAAHLRNEIDLEALGVDLRDVVATTMQPRHVSLWLRSTP